MPLRTPKYLWTDDAQLARWGRQVVVSPDDATVTTAKLADHAVTPVKLSLPNADGKFAIRRAGVMVYDTFLDADAPPTIARKAYVDAGDAAATTTAAAALAAHVLAADPHPQYALDTDLSAIQATGTYTGAFTGTTTDPAPTIRYSKVGKVVALYLPLANATSNATSFTITGAPAAIQPTRAQTMLAIVRDNGTVQIGTASMGTSGTLTFGNGASGGVFTNSGTKGIELITLTYSLD